MKTKLLISIIFLGLTLTCQTASAGFFDDIGDFFSNTANTIKDTGENVGNKIKDTGENVGNTIINQRQGSNYVRTDQVYTTTDGTEAKSYTIPDLDQVLTNLATQTPELIRLVSAIAYVLGMFLCIKGVMHFKKSNDNTQEWSPKQGIIFLLVGACLLYLPSTIDVVKITFFANESPLAYIPTGDSGFQRVLDAAGNVLKLIGVICVVKGLRLFTTQPNNNNPHPGEVGIAHLIGGVCCIHMNLVLSVLFTTIGLTF